MLRTRIKRRLTHVRTRSRATSTPLASRRSRRRAELLVDPLERTPPAPPFAVAARRQLEEERPAVIRVRTPPHVPAALEPAHDVGRRRERHAELAGELGQAHLAADADQAQRRRSRSRRRRRRRARARRAAPSAGSPRRAGAAARAARSGGARGSALRAGRAGAGRCGRHRCS